MSKKKLYTLIGIVIVLILILIGLSKSGALGNKKKGKEVEIADVAEMTIIETVSATGKIQPETE
ncbi:MAG: efflux RND transporter periplasmic adaptor subunit, partial [Flavobacterium sp.]